MIPSRFDPDIHLRLALCIMDVIAAFAIVYLMQVLTKGACFTGERQAKWAMIRRAVLAIGAVSLFCKGVWRFERGQPVEWIEFGTQIGIILSLILFPILRAFDVITQDEMKER